MLPSADPLHLPMRVLQKWKEIIKAALGDPQSLGVRTPAVTLMAQTFARGFLAFR